MNDIIRQLEDELERQNQAFSLVLHALAAAGQELVSFDGTVREEFEDACTTGCRAPVVVYGAVRV